MADGAFAGELAFTDAQAFIGLKAARKLAAGRLKITTRAELPVMHRVIEPAQVKLAYAEFKKEPSPMDYEDVKNIAQDILERSGYTVVKAETGKDGIRLFKNHINRVSTRGRKGTKDSRTVALKVAIRVFSGMTPEVTVAVEPKG